MAGILRWVLAVLVAGSISFGSFFLGQQAERETQPVSAPSVTVYQAVEDITLGFTFEDLLAAEVIQPIIVPDFAAPPGSITPENPPSTGTILSLNLRAGQLLSELQFREFDELVEASGVNPEAFQVTLALTSEQAVAGLVRSGSIVTIFATYQEATDSDAQFVTEVVVPEAPVSLVGLAGEGEGDRGLTYITLTLDAADSQKLVHYMKSADLHLSLFGAQARAENLAPVVGMRTIVDAGASE